MSYILNEYGLRIWQHISKPWYVNRSYEWVDRVLVINCESAGNIVEDEAKFSEFDFSDWIPVSEKRYRGIKRLQELEASRP